MIQIINIISAKTSRTDNPPVRGKNDQSSQSPNCPSPQITPHDTFAITRTAALRRTPPAARAPPNAGRRQTAARRQAVSRRQAAGRRPPLPHTAGPPLDAGSCPSQCGCSPLNTAARPSTSVDSRGGQQDQIGAITMLLRARLSLN
jgi:hypothetical protein